MLNKIENGNGEFVKELTTRLKIPMPPIGLQNSEKIPHLHEGGLRLAPKQKCVQEESAKMDVTLNSGT